MKFTPELINVAKEIDMDGHAIGYVQSHTRANHPPLHFYKLVPEAFIPTWGTQYAACFDLRACLVAGIPIKAYDVQNLCYEITPSNVGTLGNGKLHIEIRPKHRVMVPTGLTFDIPVGYSVRLHSRSGLAVKKSLVLANHEGVVDSDYVDPTYVVLQNHSRTILTVYHGDRLAQAEMVPDIAYELIETSTKPLQKSDRNGGFGSTGDQ